MIKYEVEVQNDGQRTWCVNGILHREDGPAVEQANGDRFWYINGKLHREDGPACEHASGLRRWYLNGDRLTEAEFVERNQLVKELTVAEIEALLGHRVNVVK